MYGVIPAGMYESPIRMLRTPAVVPMISIGIGGNTNRNY